MHVSSSSLSLGKPEIPWIERKFTKRECKYFSPNVKEPTRCNCGLERLQHVAEAVFTSGGNKWSPERNTIQVATDAHGTIEFHTGPHPAKAQYVRLSHDTSPVPIYQLLKEHWCLRLPNLLVSVHGGIANFKLQPKLKRTFDRGLLRAAKTTGAWIITGGTNTGVVKHVGEALGDSLAQSRHNIVTIGIAPWGVIHNRNDLAGSNTITPYHAVRSPRGTDVVVSGNHSYFLLADNGTVGKFGAEIGLRKKLEKYISQQIIPTGSGSKKYGTPLVCLVLEGGTNIIRSVLEFVTDTPPVPVVVADGSGRAADLLAFTHKYAQEDGTMPENLRDQLIATIERTFKYSRQQAEKVFIELMLCVRKKELITVFRISEGNEEIDLAILTALLKSQKYNVVDQLSLTLTWNRADIARSHIFGGEQDWPEGALCQAMMDALVHDRVQFVQLLIENGVDMHKWLTIQRLEELYNTGLKTIPAKSSTLFIRSGQNHHPASTLVSLIKEYKKHLPADYHYTLQDIGLVIEKMMGGAYRASYCRRRFRQIHHSITQKESSNLHELPAPRYFNVPYRSFRYPFSELMIWAVLFQRQAMAKFLWQHGEEALAKALIAMKLYKTLTHEAEQNDLEIDVTQKLKSYSREFGNLATDLLEHCYTSDDDRAQQLLTYELCNWSDATCLSLAVLGNHREFLANSSCQILLTDMWMGGLRMSKYINLKVILGILVFPLFLVLDYKTKEELQQMPQTVDEHIHEMEDSSSDSDSSSESFHEIPRSPPHKPPAAFDQSSIGELKQPLHPTLQDGLMSLYDLNSKGEGGSTYSRKSNPLSLGKKIYEFYTAPITKFWAHTFGYVVFLIIYTFFVLARTPASPSWLEGYIIAYVFSLTIDKIRQIVLSEPNKFLQKLGVYFSKLWNICDAIAIVLFCIAVALRFIERTLGVARVFYCVDIVLWYVRVLDLFSVNKHLGPYTMMIGKMLKDMIYFIVILLLMLVAFGILRQSVTFPDKDLSWQLLWNVFHEPYFMLYGEVYAGDIDPPCSDDPDSEFKCVPGRWVVPAVMALYLIVANILLINLLIAVFNNTFQLVNAISNQVWKFQRYSLVIEFESRPILPPPAIVICHLYQLGRLVYRTCRRKGMEYLDNGLKLFLEVHEVETLHDFEEECMEEYFREKTRLNSSSVNELIRVTTDRVENISLRLDDLSQKENSIKLSLQTVDRRLGKMEEHIKNINDAMEVMARTFVAHSPQDSIPEETAETAADAGGGGLQRLDFLTRSTDTELSEARLRPFTDYKKPRRPPYLRAHSLGSGAPDPAAKKSGAAPRAVPYYGHRQSKPPPTHAHKPGGKWGGRTGNVGIRPGSIKLGVLPRDAPRLSPVVDTSVAPSAVSSPTAEQRSGPTSPQELLEMVRAAGEEQGTGGNGEEHPGERADRPRQSSMAINSIVTPTRVEYTSITDDIDTSCVDYPTPHGSPAASRRFSLGVDVDVDLYTRRYPGPGGGGGEEKLRSAEDSHHTQLEGVIARRMRQISLTENASLVDLAKHVISVEEEAPDAGEPHVHSDDEDLHASHDKNTLCVDWGERLKASKSEPFLPQGDDHSSASLPSIQSGVLPGGSGGALGARSQLVSESDSTGAGDALPPPRDLAQARSRIKVKRKRLRTASETASSTKSQLT